MKDGSRSHAKSLLIIFYRNPEIGKVKTRLASSVGDAKALAIYFYLVAHTREITENLAVDKVVFYSDYVNTEDNWSDPIYKKRLQSGRDLGERMSNAFHNSFSEGYQSICIIGTDCFELTSSILTDAFGALSSSDVVIGPAKDGGYYLLGMNKLHRALFENKSWSTNDVCGDTIRDIENLALKYHKLPTISDVDEVTDLPAALQHLK